jgi:beta-N-acetylhexosaminidase
VLRSEDELAEGDLAPFRAAMRAGVPAMVLSHGLYAADDFVTPGSLSRRIVTELLRERLGFDGVAITDNLTSPAVVSLYEVPDAAVTALRAGADMLQVTGSPESQADAYDAVLSAAVAGRIDHARIDQAVTRVLSLKQAYGLLETAGSGAGVSSGP